MPSRTHLHSWRQRGEHVPLSAQTCVWTNFLVEIYCIVLAFLGPSDAVRICDVGFHMFSIIIYCTIEYKMVSTRGYITENMNTNEFQCEHIQYNIQYCTVLFFGLNIINIHGCNHADRIWDKCDMDFHMFHIIIYSTVHIVMESTLLTAFESGVTSRKTWIQMDFSVNINCILYCTVLFFGLKIINIHGCNHAVRIWYKCDMGFHMFHIIIYSTVHIVL